MDPPLVNGVSPCEGPPGTKVKIWGENLGLSAADITSIMICGQECVEMMEWVSDHKILCESGGGIGRGRIIVTSQSGGFGTCTVYFTGLEPTSPGSPRLDPESESSVWMDENWEVFGSDQTVIEGLPALSGSKSHFSDPLGIIKGRVGRKVSMDVLQQLGRPEGSANLLAEDFNPVLFLLENHCGTSYQQLQQGLDHLKGEVEKTQQAPAQFIENNLDAFIQCYDALSDVNKLMLTNEKDSDGLTDKLENYFRSTTLEAEALFQGLLNRKLKADTTRNALTVLQRYRFLFNLPRSIERNIKNFEYEIVTNDYERAKSLFAGTKVKVFAKVLKEVESMVSKFRSDLRKQLLTNPTTFENQKKLIKYLLDLDYVGDPCWECVSGMHSWLLSQLLEAKMRYQTDTEFLDVPSIGRGHSRTQSNSSGGSVYSKATVGSHSRNPDSTHDASSKPKRIQFIEKLIDIIANNLPNFFKLGQAYFNRSLFNTTLNENQDNIISENISTKVHVFDEMLLEVCEVYTDLVNASLFEDALTDLPPDRVSKLGDWKPFDDDLAEVSGAWLPLCVRKIRTCLSLLQDLPLPAAPLFLVQQLSLNVCTLSSDTLFLRTTKDIEGLSEREDWRVQDEEGSIITSLPVLFENIVIDVLLTVKEIVIETHPGETKEQRDQLSSSSVEYFQGLLEDFCECLTMLAAPPDGESIKSSITRQETFSGALSEDNLNVPLPEEQLLLILSNSYYTRQYVSPRLFDCFMSHGYPSCPQVEQKFIEQLGELERKVFEYYIRLKVGPLVKLVAPGIHGGYFDWGTDSVPKGIRSYIKEILLYFVHVHAEVSSISEHITQQVLSQLLEKLIDEFHEQLSIVTSFSNQGRLVGYIELLVLQDTLAAYVTPSTRDKFMEIYDVIGSKLITKSYGRNIRDLSESFHESNSLQFRCFRATESF